jgi:lipopolysaccharide transport system permease protein
MFRWIVDLYRWRELTLILAQRNLKVRYKGSTLGFFWSLLTPLFLIAVYAVFLRLVRSDDSHVLFMPRLVTGIVCWQFLALCVGDSLSTVIGSAPLVKKTAFPRMVLPASMVAANTVNFLLSALVLCVYLAFAPGRFAALQWLPLVLACHMALCLGLGSLFSALNVRFRDTAHIVSVLLLAWFFLSPVVYTIDLIPESARLAAFLNPMTGLLTAYRQVLLGDAGPASAWGYAVSGTMCWLALAIGVAVFLRMQKRFAELL